MTPDQTRAVLTVALMAAFADGLKDDRERTAHQGARRPPAGRRHRPRRALPGGAARASRSSPTSCARSPPTRARAVRLRDGGRASSTPTARTPAPKARSSTELAQTLGLPAAAARDYVAEADAIAAVPGVPAAGAATAAVPAPAAARRRPWMPPRSTSRSSTRRSPTPRWSCCPNRSRRWRSCRCRCASSTRSARRTATSSTRGTSRNSSPRSAWASPASTSSSSAASCWAACSAAVLGGMGRGVGRQAASSGMAFASTWALGQVAKQYYASGRKLDIEKLKPAFTPLVQQGQSMIQQYGPQIAERAKTINVKSLPQLIASRLTRTCERRPLRPRGGEDRRGHRSRRAVEGEADRQRRQRGASRTARTTSATRRCRRSRETASARPRSPAGPMHMYEVMNANIGTTTAAGCRTSAHASAAIAAPAASGEPQPARDELHEADARTTRRAIVAPTKFAIITTPNQTP